MDSLNRTSAPFDETVWRLIDDTAIQAAAAVLTARRFLPVEGPFGLGLTAIEGGSDDIAERDNPADAVAILGAPLSVPMLWKGFGLSLRRLAAYREHGQPLDLAVVVDAAGAMARLEERLVYHGDSRTGLVGLLTAPDTQEVTAGDWGRVDQVLKDVLAAVTMLDDSGHAGPYALVAAPHLYNGLFRRYADSDLLQVDHLGRLCSAGIYKAPIPGAVIVDPKVGRLIVGQDLTAGFASLDGVHCRLFLVESLVMAIDDARAVCRIRMAGEE